ncbi:MAG: alpha/beta fold hydrolase [Casimicrobiaceae bacterium]
MRYRISAILAAMLSIAPAMAQPAIDEAREDRWAQEIVPSIVVGEAVWLATPARAKVLAILTEPAGAPKGGVVVVHGLGVHPDFGMIGGARVNLADAGFTTLSVQMPVLAAGATRDDYAVALPAASERIAAALAYLRAKGIRKIAIVSHSMGATMANAFLARPGAASVDAWVPVGMLVDFAAAPKEPLLDIVAGNDFPEVVASAPLRATRLPRDACSRPLTIEGTDHYFENRQKELSAAIAAFLDRVFSGRCVPG